MAVRVADIEQGGGVDRLTDVDVGVAARHHRLGVDRRIDVEAHPAALPAGVGIAGLVEHPDPQEVGARAGLEGQRGQIVDAELEFAALGEPLAVAGGPEPLEPIGVQEERIPRAPGGAVVAAHPHHVGARGLPGAQLDRPQVGGRDGEVLAGRTLPAIDGPQIAAVGRRSAIVELILRDGIVAVGIADADDVSERDRIADLQVLIVRRSRPAECSGRVRRSSWSA